MIHYDSAFFKSQREISMRSARAMLPLVQQIVKPNSVVDIGCGVGPWLAVWDELGVTDYGGYDGDYVDRSMLYISKDKFHQADISKPLQHNRKYDLAMTLEVGEHLPEDKADLFVENLVGFSDVVLFSAAIPGQGGTAHINEQWPIYWVEKFKNNGYEVIDCLRQPAWNDEKIAYYYRQNIFLFVKKELISIRPDYETLYEKYGNSYLSLVHPETLTYMVEYIERSTRVNEMNKNDVVYLWRLFKKAFAIKIKEKLGLTSKKHS